MLQKPHDPNLTDAVGDSALAMAASEGHVEVARILLEASKDLANDDVFTALMCASAKGHVEVVRILLEAGANMDLAGDAGYTALLFASTWKLYAFC